MMNLFFPGWLPVVTGLWLLPLTLAPLQAGQVFWALNRFGKNIRSDGQALPAATRFQLGVFTGGFTPVLSNMADWASHWRCWVEIGFDPAVGGFSEEVIFDENPSPFVEGTPFYCWAWLPVSASQSEYFLATGTTWKVPGTDPLTFPVNADLETAGTVIIGATLPEDEAIRTATVNTGVCPPFFFIDWQRLHFDPDQRANNGISGPDADPDGDGRSNLLEYLTGTPPDRSDSGNVLNIRADADDSPSVMFFSPASARGAWAFESSTTLSDWTQAAGDPFYDPLAEEWSLSLPVEGPRGFRRLHVLAPAAP